MTIWTETNSNHSYTPNELLNFLKEKATGIVLLEGDSGCGKTSILKMLKEDSPKPVHIVSYETFLQKYILPNIVNKLENHITVNPIPDGCTYAIEDIDFLRGRLHTQLHLGALFNEKAADSLIILTGIRIPNRIPDLYRVLSDPIHFTGKSELDEP